MRKAIKLNIVRDHGMAAKAGLVPGDLLLSYGGVDLVSAEDLTSSVKSATGPSAVEFVRAGKIIRTPVDAGALDISFSEIDVDDSTWVAAAPEDFVVRSPDELLGMVVTTAPSIDGFVAVKQLGVVTSECVFGLNFFKDLFAAVSDIFGGRSKTTQKALRDAREKCIDELKAEAFERGANAIIAVSLDYSEFSGQGKSMLFLVASGTAVVVKPVGDVGNSC